MNRIKQWEKGAVSMAGWISKLIKKNKSMAVPAQAQNAAEPVLSAKDARV